jgi:hypothetical protein
MTGGNRDFILLGIKYESAKLAGVGGAALENIAKQLRDEVGENWETDPMVIRGRESVRREHGLEIPNASSEPGEEQPPERPRWNFLRRRSW